MKKTTWILIGFVCTLALMAAADVVRLQSNPATVVESGVTSGAYAAITNNTAAYPTNAIIYTTSTKDVAVQWKAELSGAGTSANTLTIQQSVDGSNWQTLIAIPMTPAGTTAVTVVTNISVGAAPYLRVYSIANANGNTGYITNYTVKAFVK